MKNKRCTLLGVGPMSKNCVDATIEIANQTSIPLMLIASRRQIDSDEFGGGYVEHWTTREFASYIRENDKRGNIFLARDHGGPWQNPAEISASLGLRDAMESAKRSYAADIDAGFQILHIDPSIDPYGSPRTEDVLDRVFELYEFCCSYAGQKNREVAFEIGTEEQSGTTSSQQELRETLKQVFEFTEANDLPGPSFVVVQTGTRVMEARNVGTFDSPIRVVGEVPAEILLPKMIEICNSFKILMKEHNTDYLSDESLAWHPRLGIHSANVAPEFGVTESRAFLNLCREQGRSDLGDQFLQISLDSQKWKKWMLPNSLASDEARAIIAGHYIFSDERFMSIKQSLQDHCSKKAIEVDSFLRSAVKTAVMRYVSLFRLAN